MTDKTKSYIVWAVIAAVFFVPRIALLGNGLDGQRIWDTNTPYAFRFLYAADNGTLLDFYRQDKKYPLLGSYVYLPVIGIYYGVGVATHIFSSANDFINAYALGETTLFFWIRLFMLLLNFASVILLAKLVRCFTHNSLRAAVYAVVFAVVNFYFAMFAVSPRIHSMGFFISVVALYASFLLVENKSLRRYILAFLACGAAASISQSGFVTLVLPIMAHLYDAERRAFRWRDPKPALIGLGVFIAMVVFVGYPKFLTPSAPLATREYFVESVLSNEHAPPLFSPRFTLPFLRTYATSELVTFWGAIVAFWYFFCAKKKDRPKFEIYDSMAFAHAAAFFLAFGFSNVMTSRFTLVAMPSIFFLLARFFLPYEKNLRVLIPLVFFVVIQAFGIGQLTAIAFGGDTRADAVAFLLEHTNEHDRILSTVDNNLLGVVPSPESVRRGRTGSSIGVMESLIAERNLVSERSRDFTYWDLTTDNVEESELSSFRYVVVSSDYPHRYRAEEYLVRNQFRPVASFFASRKEDAKSRMFIPWDIPTPTPRFLLPLSLRAFRAFGPTLVLYER